MPFNSNFSQVTIIILVKILFHRAQAIPLLKRSTSFTAAPERFPCLSHLPLSLSLSRCLCYLRCFLASWPCLLSPMSCPASRLYSSSSSTSFVGFGTTSSPALHLAPIFEPLWLCLWSPDIFAQKMFFPTPWAGDLWKPYVTFGIFDRLRSAALVSRENKLEESGWSLGLDL